jgi:leucine dehydrogenase
MAYFKQMAVGGHKQVVLCSDPPTGLQAIIAIHSTVLGPALGGCRMWPFATEEAAITDALRLAQSMTLKNAAAGLDLGGGKAVIIGDPKKDKTPALFRAFGRFVQTLGGRYITAEDVGTCEKDMEEIRAETSFVTGRSRALGGSGDPSPYTALGCFEGIRASVKYKMKSESLKGLRVAVQGVGNVGFHLCGMLKNEGVELLVSDIFPERVEKAVAAFKARVVEPDKIVGAEAEVFAPCALGASVNDETIPRLKCAIIAGAANNQLLDEQKHGTILQDKGILYAPDFIINAGGVINVFYEVINQYDQAAVTRKVKQIYQTLEEVYRMAEAGSITTVEAAHRLAQRRLDGHKQKKGK